MDYMKTSGIILFFFILLHFTSLQAQVQPSGMIGFASDSDDKSYISLAIDKQPVTFEFNSFSDFKYGIGQHNPPRSSVSIEANTGWKLVYSADQNLINQDGIHQIQADNIGLSIEILSQNNFILWQNNETEKLSLSPTVLLTGRKNKNNKGKSKISLDILWEMGTQRGNMCPSSLLDQNLKSGTYTTTVQFVITESL
ncbi:hypothetical protein [Mangrovibacterium marinum]|uniref:hypothetical protein n=1 Tax=Mangrovibacterium marinum TaxID=1639118 RepID=UPI0011B2023C|nr:hypothetical protein [Mangrovibacterium marinum]